MSKLAGKVAVITGGNSGIGLATVKLFLEEGAKVVFTGRRQEALDEVSKELSGDFLAVKADAASPADSKVVVEKTVEKFGKIDILFLNAGIAHFAPITDITEEHFDTHFNINVKGPFFTIKEATPHLNDNAAILINTSVVNGKGFPNAGVYSATKAAVRSLVRVLANELADRGIRTLSVAPGPIATPIYDKMGMPQEQMEGMSEQFSQMVPLKRFGSPEEVAKAVLFLASDDASYITGVQLDVDGGLNQV